jgi:hypothetical protein
MLAQKADSQVMSKMLETKAEVTAMDHFEADIDDLNKKINHLIIFQNEMLTTTLDPQNIPKTNYYGPKNESSIVDQKKI